MSSDRYDYSYKRLGEGALELVKPELDELDRLIPLVLGDAASIHSLREYARTEDTGSFVDSLEEDGLDAPEFFKVIRSKMEDLPRLVAESNYQGLIGKLLEGKTIQELIPLDIDWEELLDGEEYNDNSSQFDKVGSLALEILFLMQGRMKAKLGLGVQTYYNAADSEVRFAFLESELYEPSKANKALKKKLGLQEYSTVEYVDSWTEYD